MALAPDFMKLLVSSIIGTANASELALLSYDIATRYLDLRDPRCFIPVRSSLTTMYWSHL